MNGHQNQFWSSPILTLCIVIFIVSASGGSAFGGNFFILHFHVLYYTPMLDFQQMMVRLLVSLVLGALLGVERELVGKEAGIRTGLMVSSGAAIFTMIGLTLPYIAAPSASDALQIIVNNGGYFNIIGNIVVGTGFLGAGIIIKTQEHVHGMTTAAVIWATAAIGVLSGLGIFKFAAATTVLFFLVLLLVSHVSIYRESRK
jgi:putative Mg2+ transporter-C (MgtC) family protein